MPIQPVYSRFLVLVSLIFLPMGVAAAGYVWFKLRPSEDIPPGLVVRETRRDIGAVPLKTYTQLDFPVTNPSDRPMRILGFRGG